MKPCSPAPEDDEKLYCEGCRSFFDFKCEVHGPALFVPDTPVPVGVPDRARKTLPRGLEVRQSDIPGAGLGVFFNGKTVIVGAHFGPYEGEMVDKEEAMKSGYSWVIYRSGQSEEYIDAKSETQVNWMRYVNCARNEEEQNLVAFQYRGEIFYRCCRLIEPGQELLVWYEDDYAKHLDISFDNLWEQKCFAKERNNATAEVFSCSLCPLSYPSHSFLHRHINRRHPGKYERLQLDKVKNEKGISPTSPRPLQMNSSERKVENHPSPDCFTKRNAPQRHSGKGRHKCPECGKSFSRHNVLVEHQRIHTGERPYLCSQCGKSFSQLATLKTHQLIHTGERPYDCSQCGKGFRKAHHLQSHKLIHTGEKPYRCSQCGKSFRKNNHLKMHQHIHSGEKPHKCTECGKGFRDEGSLKTHQRIHTGERPYPCSQCQKSFRDVTALRTHQRTHSDEKPYPCSQCGKSFRDAPALRMHQRVHTGEKPYRCLDCGKSFSVFKTLSRHQRIHTGEKPYRCSQCGKSFHDGGTLRKHERIHTGVKPHPCSECEKTFTQKCHLKRHQLKHVGEKPHH